MQLEIKDILHKSLLRGIPQYLPPHPGIDYNVPHAPKRYSNLSQLQLRQAVSNALRYFPKQHHPTLGKQFLQQLKDYGHIYMYRYRPVDYQIKAYSIDLYPTQIKQASAIIHNIMNNLNPEVAQFPHQLITYGGNGSVFQNWGQYALTMKYLCQMQEDQTLIMNSGHPQGLYPSYIQSPKMVISNGMMVPNYSTKQLYQKFYAMGTTMYGQMTAGSFCYIGSQGIVHGTTLTLLNAARKYKKRNDMTGLVYVTSGLGGMSGAQPKAGDICGCISVIAQVVQAALDKRLKQGWLKQKITNVQQVQVILIRIPRIIKAKQNKEVVSIGFLGNIVLLWQKLSQLQENIVDLGSDQTSCHNPYGGGYYPVSLSVQQSNVRVNNQEMMVNNPGKFKQLVQDSLRRQVAAINKLTCRGMNFWDYGNSFLLEASRSGADIMDKQRDSKFRYPSYVQDIMGDIFELGFGPFRWVCTSADPEDLKKTDQIAYTVLTQLHKESPPQIQQQLSDNIKWIEKAQQNKLVIGSQARILYVDHLGRTKLAKQFTQHIRKGIIKGPIILSRDHHDVSGADSPFRQTSSVYDGSMFTADMAVQNFVGGAIRGATWVALHNGGGVGWGEVINGGFGMVLSGQEGEQKRVSEFLFWDVSNGVSRRAWGGGKNANWNLKRIEEYSDKIKVTKGKFISEQELQKVFND